MSRTPSTPPPLTYEEECTNPFFDSPTLNRTQAPHQTQHSTKMNKFLNTPLKKGHKNEHSMLYTPQTPCVTGSSSGFPSNDVLLPMSPQTTTKKNHGVVDVFSVGNTSKSKSIDHTQLRTPERTPRHYRKRDMFDLGEEQHHQQLNLLQHQHNLLQQRGGINVPVSTIGTGRSPRCTNRRVSNGSSSGVNQNLLEFRSSIKIQLAVNESEEDSEDLDLDEDEDDLDEREQKLMNYHSSDDEMNQTPYVRKLQYDVEEPKTPTKQIMSEDFILENLGNEKCQQQEEEDLEFWRKDFYENLHIKRKLSNPFIENNSLDFVADKRRKLREKANLKDENFKDRIEMIYHATGEKFFVKLNNSEKSNQLIPKRLNFSDISDSDESNNELRFYQHKVESLIAPKGKLSQGLIESQNNTPMKNNRHYKMTIHGLLNRDEEVKIGNSSDDNNNDEIVKHHPIKNPFKNVNVNNDASICRSKAYQELAEVEYINQTTGDRVTEQLDGKIKPKKLDFSNC